MIERSLRMCMPDRRRCTTSKLKVNGQSVFMTVGFKDDGSIGELFVDLNKHGTFAREWAGAVGILASILLQTGSSVRTVVRAIRNISDPSGVLEAVANELENLGREDKQ